MFTFKQENHKFLCAFLGIPKTAEISRDLRDAMMFKVLCEGDVSRAPQLEEAIAQDPNDSEAYAAFLLCHKGDDPSCNFPDAIKEELAKLKTLPESEIKNRLIDHKSRYTKIHMLMFPEEL